MEREWKKSNSLFAHSQYGVVYTVLLYIQNVQWAGLWVLIGFTNVRMLLLVSVLRIEQMLTIDPCAVCTICKSGRENNTHNQTLCHKMLPSPFIFTQNENERKKKFIVNMLLWFCLFIFLLFYIFYSVFIRICHSFNAFSFMFGFSCSSNALYVLEMKRARVRHSIRLGNSILPNATVFHSMFFFLYSYFAWWKFGRIEWLIWIEPIYVT